LLRALEDFFPENPQTVVLEDGHAIFEMASAHYSLSAERGRCLLHLGSEERNLVRTVCSVRPRKDALHLETQRFGHGKFTRRDNLALRE
jgi:hypothetical protein